MKFATKIINNSQIGNFCQDFFLIVWLVTVEATGGANLLIVLARWQKSRFVPALRQRHYGHHRMAWTRQAAAGRIHCKTKINKQNYCIMKTFCEGPGIALHIAWEKTRGDKPRCIINAFIPEIIFLFQAIFHQKSWWNSHQNHWNSIKINLLKPFIYFCV